jgi:hypothetical protein
MLLQRVSEESKDLPVRVASEEKEPAVTAFVLSLGHAHLAAGRLAFVSPLTVLYLLTQI